MVDLARARHAFARRYPRSLQESCHPAIIFSRWPIMEAQPTRDYRSQPKHCRHGLNASLLLSAPRSILRMSVSNQSLFCSIAASKGCEAQPNPA